KVLFNVACRRLRLAFQIAMGHFQSLLNPPKGVWQQELSPRRAFARNWTQSQ
ncbi:unnamed protein product, partial [Closterium sp. Naga37s-1]